MNFTENVSMVKHKKKGHLAITKPPSLLSTILPNIYSSVIYNPMISA